MVELSISWGNFLISFPKYIPYTPTALIGED
jgi:hypothetical protein